MGGRHHSPLGSRVGAGAALAVFCVHVFPMHDICVFWLDTPAAPPVPLFRLFDFVSLLSQSSICKYITNADLFGITVVCPCVCCWCWCCWFCHSSTLKLSVYMRARAHPSLTFSPPLPPPSVLRLRSMTLPLPRLELPRPFKVAVRGRLRVDAAGQRGLLPGGGMYPVFIGTGAARAT